MENTNKINYNIICVNPPFAKNNYYDKDYNIIKDIINKNKSKNKIIYSYKNYIYNNNYKYNNYLIKERLFQDYKK